jgi:hypothetical protein
MATSIIARQRQLGYTASRHSQSSRARDAESHTVSLRDRLEGDLGAMPIAQALARLSEGITTHRVRKTFSGSATLEGKATGNEY